MISIGPYSLPSRVLLAPMAGITDQPFRQLCRAQGAALTPSEMLSANLRLWDSRKSRLRRCHAGEPGPVVVQIAGSEPAMMAEAARINVAEGAQIIDINMGCPAKKVLRRAAGSALLQDERQVQAILQAVVAAVSVPVTLKIRSGWSPEHRNGPVIARIAEDSGIAALAVHGRTRACMFRGEAEYDTIARIRETVQLPVFANGDITTPQKAREVLAHSGADAVMIGRAAQGRPWIFREIQHFLEHGTQLPPLPAAQVESILISHLHALYAFYGDIMGVRIARKHVGWYCVTLPGGRDMRSHFNTLEDSAAQIDCVHDFFHGLRHNHDSLTDSTTTTGGIAA